MPSLRRPMRLTTVLDVMSVRRDGGPPFRAIERRGLPLEPGSQGVADAGWVAVGPGPFNEHAPGTPVAGEGEAGTSNPLPGRALGGELAAGQMQV
jgi:hypothetical protein